MSIACNFREIEHAGFRGQYWLYTQTGILEKNARACCIDVRIKCVYIIAEICNSLLTINQLY